MPLPRFASLSEIARGTAGAARRFPWVVVCVIVSLVCAEAFFAGEKWRGSEPYLWVRVWMLAQTGVPLFFALTLVGEEMRGKVARALPFGGLALLASWGLYALGHPRERWANEGVGVLAASHLLAAFLPFLLPRLRRCENAFWQFNRILFLRFVVAAVFTGTITVGTVVALLAVKNLLGITISTGSYWRAFVYPALGFNTLFFLAGVPRDLASLDDDTTYPTVVRLFAQYVLLPLLTLYLVIVYAYGIRIAVNGELSKGMVGPLVCGVGGLGVFTLLLLRPAAERPGGRWIALFSRLFFAAVLPALALFFVAVGMRVRQYGFTEERLALFVLGGWLAALSVFALVRKGFALVVVPTSLFAVVMLGTFGPWSVFAFSLRDQVARFRETALQAGLLSPEGRLEPATREVPFALRKELSQIAVYLATSHGKDVFARFLTDDVRERSIRSMQPRKPGGVPVAQGPEDAVREAWKELGITFVSAWDTRDSRTAALRRSDSLGTEGAAVPVGGFDYLVPLELRDYRGNEEVMKMELGGEGHVHLPKNFSPMSVSFRGETFLVPLTALEARLDAEPDVWTGAARPPNASTDPEALAAFDIAGTQGAWRYLVRVRELRARKTDEGKHVEYLDGVLLLDSP